MLLVILFSPRIPGFRFILMRGVPKKQTIEQDQSAKDINIVFSGCLSKDSLPPYPVQGSVRPLGTEVISAGLLTDFGLFTAEIIVSDA